MWVWLALLSLEKLLRQGHFSVISIIMLFCVNIEKKMISVIETSPVRKRDLGTPKHFSSHERNLPLILYHYKARDP